MRIRVDDERARAGLVSELTAAGCTTLAIGRTIEVVPDEQHAGDAVALSFFLRAWQMENPSAKLVVLGQP
jgi:hypothetical protein